MLSNVCMEDFKRIPKDTLIPKGHDIFVIWSHWKIMSEKFSASILTTKKSLPIELRNEVEGGNNTTFLTVLTHKQTVYRKENHAGRYLHHDPNHPRNIQCGMVKC